MIQAIIELHKPLFNTNPITMLFSDDKVFEQWLAEPKNSDYIKKVISVLVIKEP